jgi:hypothetical protein
MKITKSTLKHIILEEQKLIMKERGAKPVDTKKIIFTYYLGGELKTFEGFNIDEAFRSLGKDESSLGTLPKTGEKLDKIDVIAKEIVPCQWRDLVPGTKEFYGMDSTNYYNAGVNPKTQDPFRYQNLKKHLLIQIPELKDLKYHQKTYDGREFDLPVLGLTLPKLREKYKEGSDKYKGFCPVSVTVVGAVITTKSQVYLNGQVGSSQPSDHKRVSAADKEEHGDSSWAPKSKEEIDAEIAAGKRSKFNDPYKKPGLSESLINKIVKEEIKKLK